MLEYGTAFAARLLALLIDIRLGEPPSRFHPVVWMGRYLDWAAHRTPVLPNNASVLFQRGATYWLLGAFFVILTSLIWQINSITKHPLGFWVLTLLKCCFNGPKPAQAALHEALTQGGAQ